MNKKIRKKERENQHKAMEYFRNKLCDSLKIPREVLNPKHTYKGTNNVSS